MSKDLDYTVLQNEKEENLRKEEGVFQINNLTNTMRLEDLLPKHQNNPPPENNFISNMVHIDNQEEMGVPQNQRSSQVVPYQEVSYSGLVKKDILDEQMYNERQSLYRM